MNKSSGPWICQSGGGMIQEHKQPKKKIINYTLSKLNTLCITGYCKKK